MKFEWSQALMNLTWTWNFVTAGAHGVSNQAAVEAEILEDEMAVARLAGFLIKNYADKIRSDCQDGKCRVQLHFDH